MTFLHQSSDNAINPITVELNFYDPVNSSKQALKINQSNSDFFSSQLQDFFTQKQKQNQDLLSQYFAIIAIQKDSEGKWQFLLPSLDEYDPELVALYGYFFRKKISTLPVNSDVILPDFSSYPNLSSEKKASIAKNFISGIVVYEEESRQNQLEFSEINFYTTQTTDQTKINDLDQLSAKSVCKTELVEKDQQSSIFQSVKYRHLSFSDQPSKFSLTTAEKIIRNKFLQLIQASKKNLSAHDNAVLREEFNKIFRLYSEQINKLTVQQHSPQDPQYFINSLLKILSKNHASLSESSDIIKTNLLTQHQTTAFSMAQLITDQESSLKTAQQDFVLNIGWVNGGKKISEEINTDNKRLNFNPNDCFSCNSNSFTACAFTVHHKSGLHGHYTSYVRYKDGWYEFNDNLVVKVEGDEREQKLQEDASKAVCVKFTSNVNSLENFADNKKFQKGFTNIDNDQLIGSSYSNRCWNNTALCFLSSYFDQFEQALLQDPPLNSEELAIAQKIITSNISPDSSFSLLSSNQLSPSIDKKR